MQSRLTEGLQVLSPADVCTYRTPLIIVINACRSAGIDECLRNVIPCSAQDLIDREAATTVVEPPMLCGLSTILAKVIDYCSAEGRICPIETKWLALSKRLAGPRDQAQDLPPPLISELWNETSDGDKQNCLRSQIEWAHAHGRIQVAWKYLRELKPDEWYAEIGPDPMPLLLRLLQ